MMGMIVLRYMYLLALVAWLGGMLVLAGLAAPSIFTVLQQQSVPVGRVAAGAVFGDILRKFQLAACLCGIVMVATLTGMRLLGPKPVHFAARFATVFAMFAVSVYSRFGVSSRFERVSMTLLMVNVAGGLSLLYWEAKE
jgi:hypothetical protein